MEVDVEGVGEKELYLAERVLGAGPLPKRQLLDFHGVVPVDVLGLDDSRACLRAAEHLDLISGKVTGIAPDGRTGFSLGDALWEVPIRAEHHSVHLAAEDRCFVFGFADDHANRPYGFT